MKFKSLRQATLLLLILHLAGIICIHAQNQTTSTGGIKGRIIDETHQAVYPAVVSIQGTTIGNTTNEEGRFEFRKLNPGTYTIVITGVGIQTKKIEATIAANTVTDLTDIEITNNVLLGEVSIIGKTEVRKQQELAFAITVLDIKQAYNATAPMSKLLNSISSVRIKEEGGTGSNYNFTLNGFSGNQVKFFLDGIPMDNFGSSFNLSNISANMAERIEIYKGVLPIGLGADALGGAVNIISRNDANYLDASYSYSSFHTHKASVNSAYTNLRTGFTLRANAFYNYSDNNYSVYVPIKDLHNGQVGEEKWAKRFHDQYQSGGLRLESGVVNKAYADYLLAGVILSKNDKDVQTGATMEAVYGGVKAKSESMIPSIRYKKDDLFIEGLSLASYVAYSLVNNYSLDTLARTYNWLGESLQADRKGEAYYTNSSIRNREWLANANLSYLINNHQSVTLNHVFSSMTRKIHDQVDPENESNKIPQNLTKNVTGLGWIIKYDRWNANLFGKMYNSYSTTFKRVDEYTDKARLEKMEDAKTYVGYGTALTCFVLPRLQAKLSYEHAYRLPESIEMFGDGLIQQRNPDLKPESSDNINLGITFEQEINLHTIFVESNLIYRNTKDFILKGVSLTSNPTSGYENLGSVLTNGIEGGIKYKWGTLFHAGISLTYQHIIDNQEFLTHENSFVGEGINENISYKVRLPNIPYLFGNAGFGFQFQDVGYRETELTIGYGLNYVNQYYLSFPGLGAKAGKKTIPRQLSQDISLGYSLAGGRYSMILECNNIMDSKLYDNYRLQKPGRSFHIKLRYFINK